MKYGMNLLLWTGEVMEEHLPILESLKAMGYDGVEIPIFNLESDYTLWGNRLDDLGLERTAVTVRTEEDNPISSDAAVRAKAVEETKKHSIVVRLSAPRIWSALIIPRWEFSVALVRPRTNGNGVSRVWGKWRNMLKKLTLCSVLSVSTGSKRIYSTHMRMLPDLPGKWIIQIAG